MPAEAIGFFVFVLLLCLGFGLMGEANYRSHARHMKRTREHIDRLKQRRREREEKELGGR